MSVSTKLFLLAALVALASPAQAGEEKFAPGPLIGAFGPVADIEGRAPIPDGAVFKVSFDTRLKASPGELNRTLESAARFLNMHAAAGVPAENIRLAVVVHGEAVRDLTKNAAYRAWYDEDNKTLALIAALDERNVAIYVCGQSAVYYDVTTEKLAPGATMALSAMTVHALLQQDGYTLNPF